MEYDDEEAQDRRDIEEAEKAEREEDVVFKITQYTKQQREKLILAHNQKQAKQWAKQLRWLQRMNEGTISIGA